MVKYEINTDGFGNDTVINTGKEAIYVVELTECGGDGGIIGGREYKTGEACYIGPALSKSCKWYVLGVDK